MPISLGESLIVAAGGALGCMSRFLLQHVPWLQTDRWHHTLAVNLIGCLLIGFAATLFDALGSSKTIRLLCITGFLGGFTTYSTFTLDIVSLVRQGEPTQALIYVGVTLAGGICAFMAGMWSASLIKS